MAAAAAVAAAAGAARAATNPIRRRGSWEWLWMGANWSLEEAKLGHQTERPCLCRGVGELKSAQLETWPLFSSPDPEGHQDVLGIACVHISLTYILKGHVRVISG